MYGSVKRKRSGCDKISCPGRGAARSARRVGKGALFALCPPFRTAFRSWWARRKSAFAHPTRFASDPALQLAQHQLADHVHAAVAVVQAGDGGEVFAAGVLENLGVLLGDFFQRL